MKKKEELINILENKLIYPVFQPIVSLKDGEIFAYEALSRINLQHTVFNIEELFSIAKEQNKLWELEKLCRTKALKKADSIPLNIKLFLNIDPETINDSKFKSGFTSQKLEKYNLKSDNIILELTEKTAISDMKLFNKSLKHYKDQDFKIAVDDFGSGYSGLNRLCSLFPEYIKIDITLIREIDKDIIKRSVVSGIVKLCKESNIKVVAEGIENEEELKTVINIGGDYGQGYFLGKPKSKIVDIDKRIKFKIKCLFRKESRISFINLNK